jgi:hypothetical protein
VTEILLRFYPLYLRLSARTHDKAGCMGICAACTNNRASVVSGPIVATNVRYNINDEAGPLEYE